MPRVGDKEFPYTDEGMRQANIMSRRTGQKVQYNENKGKFGYQEGGGAGFGDRITSTVNPVTGPREMDPREALLRDNAKRKMQEDWGDVYRDRQWDPRQWDNWFQENPPPGPRGPAKGWRESRERAIPMPYRPGVDDQRAVPMPYYPDRDSGIAVPMQKGGWMQEKMPYGLRPSDFDAFKRGITEEYPDENPYWGFAKEVGRGMVPPNIPPEGKLDYRRMKRGIKDILNIPESAAPDSGWVPVNPDEYPSIPEGKRKRFRGSERFVDDSRRPTFGFSPKDLFDRLG
tara:strand:+ start:370 stop:1227 length:858 start_codon:yes stop_codon:yes gene_type:complete